MNDFFKDSDKCFICGSNIVEYELHFSCKNNCIRFCNSINKCFHVYLNQYAFHFGYPSVYEIQVLNAPDCSFLMALDIKDFNIETYDDLKIVINKILKIIELE